MNITQLQTDDFNRANEAPLSGGGNWAIGTGHAQMDLTTNKVASVSSDACMVYSAFTGGDAQYAEAKITVSGTNGGGAGAGLCLRHAAAAQTFYRLVVDHAATLNVDVERQVAGVSTSIVRITQAWTDGDTWRFEIFGGHIWVFLNGVYVCGGFDTTIVGGKPGLVMSTTVTSYSIDDFACGTTFADYSPADDRYRFKPSQHFVHHTRVGGKRALWPPDAGWQTLHLDAERDRRTL